MVFSSVPTRNNRCPKVVTALMLALGVVAADQVINVQGGGGSNPSKYFWKVMETMEYESRVPIRLSYRSIGSRNSQYEMLGDANNKYKAYNDFGSGDTPMYVFCHRIHVQSVYFFVNTTGTSTAMLTVLTTRTATYHSVPSTHIHAQTK